VYSLEVVRNGPKHQTAAEIESEEVMVIARASKFVVVVVALLLTPVFLRAVLWPSFAHAVWGSAAVAIIVRMGQVALEVNDGWVTVRNFFKTTHIPVWEAEIELGENEGGLMVSDAGGRMDSEGRMLYVRPRNGKRIHIGVAPRYGKEAERIRTELARAIETARGTTFATA